MPNDLKGYQELWDSERGVSKRPSLQSLPVIGGILPELSRNIAELNETMKVAFVSSDNDSVASSKGNELYSYVYGALEAWDRDQRTTGAVDAHEATCTLRHILRSLRSLGFHR